MSTPPLRPLRPLQSHSPNNVTAKVMLQTRLRLLLTAVKGAPCGSGRAGRVNNLTVLQQPQIPHVVLFLSDHLIFRLLSGCRENSNKNINVFWRRLLTPAFTKDITPNLWIAVNVAVWISTRRVHHYWYKKRWTERAHGCREGDGGG